MDDIKIFIENILRIAPMIFLGIMGILVRIMIDGKRITIELFVSSVFIAGFVTAMTAFLIDPISVHPSFKYFVCGMAGHSSGAVLLVYRAKVIKFLKNLGK